MKIFIGYKICISCICICSKPFCFDKYLASFVRGALGKPVDLHVKCLLLMTDFKQLWNVTTCFSKTPRYQIL
jgi:hypothetical protein